MVVFRNQVPRVLAALHRPSFPGFLLLAMGACASAPFPPDLTEDRKADVAEVLADAYEEVTENYVDRVEVADVALAGLSEISGLYPSLEIDVGTEAVSVTFLGEPLHRFDRPPPADIDAWADAIAAGMIKVTERAGTPVVFPKRVFKTYMEGIANSLGHEASYVTDEVFRDLLFRKYDSGILFTYRRIETGVEVIRLDPEGRLAAQGLRRGDIITQVGNVDVAMMSPFNFDQRLWGREGSEVVVSVLREEPASSTKLRLTRWKLEAPTYELTRVDNVIELKVPYFNLRAARELTTAIDQELWLAGRHDLPTAGLILDLRRSVGGNEFSIAEMANAFLGKGAISLQRAQGVEPKRAVNASWPDHSEGLPLVVLVDGLTGGGAEIVAAALQDNARAVVIGGSTLGDGLVEQNVSLYNMGVIRMPVARAHAPSGYAIEGRGVMPQVCTSLPGAKVASLLAALHRGEGVIDAAVRTRKINPDDAAALAEHRALCPPVSDSGDLAQQVGMAILKDPALYTRLVKQGKAGS